MAGSLRLDLAFIIFIVGCVLALGVFVPGGADAAPRDVQIRSVDLAAGVIELFNFGEADEALDGWRFCTQDDDQVRVYSSFSGLDGVTIAAGGSLFIHLDDDAPADPAHIDASTVGRFAGPLDTGPYALSLYFPPVTFFDGNQMADHLQWNVGGVDDLTADERSDEAENGGVWTDQSAWIATTETTTRIELADESGAELHGPDDYTVASGAPDCNGNGTPDADDIAAGTSSDCNGNGVPDACDIASGGSADEDGDGIPDECAGPVLFHRGDANDDGALDIADATFVLAFLFTGGAAPGCFEAANANGDDSIDLSDAVRVLGFLFLGGEELPAPGPPANQCGPDESAPSIDCAAYTHCP